MHEPARPAPPPQAAPAAAADDFRVGHPLEVAALLHQLHDGEVPVQIGSPAAGHLTASLWAVDEAAGRLSFGLGGSAVPVQAQAMVDGGELTAVAYLDAVKLQFELRAPVLVRHAEAAALQAAWPAELYRFQRRDAYRVRPLARSSPSATLRHPALPEMSLTLRVVDVSNGGCALLVPHDVPPLEPGTLVNAVRIELDAATRFHAALRLQHVTAIDPGQHGLRVGCEWAALTGHAERVLQGYIEQTQKHRRLMAGGAAAG